MLSVRFYKLLLSLLVISFFSCGVKKDPLPPENQSTKVIESNEKGNISPRF